MASELPLTIVSDSVRRLRSATSAAKSPFTLSSQVQDWGGRAWEFTINFTSKKGAGMRELAAFFAKNGGPAGKFIFRCPTMARPVATDTVLVRGAGQTGETLVTDGWVVDGLAAGDFISLGSGADTRLYTVTADVTPVAGIATISIYPPLRSSPADNAPVEINAPGVVLRTTADVEVPISTAMTYKFSFDAEEAL